MFYFGKNKKNETLQSKNRKTLAIFIDIFIVVLEKKCWLEKFYNFICSKKTLFLAAWHMENKNEM